MKIWIWMLWLGIWSTLNSLTAQSLPTEARGLWVTRWDFQSPADICQIIANAKAFHFNFILFQIRGNGTVYYPSAVELSALKMRGGEFWDPLQTVLEIAHSSQLAVHVWFNVYPGWSGVTWPADQTQLRRQHPDWFIRDHAGLPQPLNPHYQWLAPTQPEVQQYLLSLCRELIQRYPIDGLHLDYVRYPGPGYSYDEPSRQVFKTKYGMAPVSFQPEWSDFRRQAITNWIARLSPVIQKINPPVILSAAVIQHSFARKYLYFQDASNWLSQQMLDFVSPMIYQENSELFETLARELLTEAAPRYVFPGIMTYHPAQTVEQIERTRRLGAVGHCLFSYARLFPKHQPGNIVQELKRRVYQDPAKWPDFPWKASAAQRRVPIIGKISTFPTPVLEQQPFHVICKLKKATVPKTSGPSPAKFQLTLLWSTDENFEKPHQISMHRLAHSAAIYQTDFPIPGQSIQSRFQFRVRITADPDEWRVNLTNQNGNLNSDQNQGADIEMPSVAVGGSSLQTIAIHAAQPTFTPTTDFGPPLEKIQGIAVDPVGKIWVSLQARRCVQVFEPDGAEAAFSPLNGGLDADGRWVPFANLHGIAINSQGEVFVGNSGLKNWVFKFSSQQGQAWPGFEVSFTPGALTCDTRQHVYLLHHWGNRWAVYNVTGDLLTTGILAGVSQCQDLAVTPDGEHLYLVGNPAGNIFKLHRSATGVEFSGSATPFQHWRGVGGVHIDPQGQMYISQTYSGRIILLDSNQQLLDVLPRQAEPLAAPRFVTTDAAGSTLYSVGLGAESPMQIVRWEQQK
ncbi:family 10 glycosylhydrolase [candidate division KSB1 bacterium]|nr:family 10 glycosylhydrolase [candidate division KSB1 bacterium]